jgi:hypothetical protein
VVRLNGEGGGRFGWGSAGVVVRSDEGRGVAPAITGVEGAPRGGARAHVRRQRQLQPSVQGGRRPGRACVLVRGGGWLAGPAGRLRSSGEGGPNGGVGRWVGRGWQPRGS